jgi:hypothetical protein
VQQFCIIMLHHVLHNIEDDPICVFCVPQSDDEEPTWSKICCSQDIHKQCPKWCLEKD